MLSSELPAKVGDRSSKSTSNKGEQAEQLDNFSKSLVQSDRKLLGDSPTFLTPSAAQFDLIYDDLLDVCNSFKKKGL